MNKLGLFFVVVLLTTSSLLGNAQNKINVDSMKKAITLKRDSMIASTRKAAIEKQTIQTKYTDSLTLARKKQTDSLVQVRIRIKDSLEEIKKVKNSKAFIKQQEKIKQNYKDSLKNVRLQFLDSVKLRRIAITDSMKKANRLKIDSMLASNNKKRDSIQALLEKNRSQQLAKSTEVKKTNTLDTTGKPTKNISLQAKIEVKREQKKKQYDNSTLLSKKWTFPRNVLQNTYTRYNYYYNANRIFQDAMASAYKKAYKKYDTLIPVYKVTPELSKVYVASQSDTIIKKASLDIQMHDPRSKWQDDLYYLIAKGYFYKADYEKAIPYLKFIIKSFKEDINESRPSSDIATKVKDKNGKISKIFSLSTKEPSGRFSKFAHLPIRNEAMLLLARAYAEEGNTSGALSFLNLLEIDTFFPRRLKPMLYEIKTSIYLREENYNSAYDNLNKAIAMGKHVLDLGRLMFLKGQLQEIRMQQDSALITFKTILKHNPDIHINVAARYKIADLIFETKNEKELTWIKSKLTTLLKEEKYKDEISKAQFYLGKIALLQKEELLAERYFSASISDTTNNMNRITAIVELLKFHYSEHKYSKALKMYNLLEKEKQLEKIPLEFTNSIKELGENETMWLMADSVLKLTNMTDAQKQKWAKHQLAQYEKSKQQTPNEFAEAEKIKSNRREGTSNFYFDDPNLIAEGIAKFKKKWKSAPNFDQWRRSELSTNNKFNNDLAIEDKIESENIMDLSYFLNLLPKEEKIAEIKENIKKSIFMLGNIHLFQISQPKQSLVYYDTLTTLFPGSEYTPKLYFNNYLAYEKLNRPDKSNEYKTLLETQFPGSYTFMFQELNDFEKSIDSAKFMYEEMYSLYKKDKYKEVVDFDSMNHAYFFGNKEYQYLTSILVAQSHAGRASYQKGVERLKAINLEEESEERQNYYEILMELLLNKMDSSFQIQKQKEDLSKKYNFDLTKRSYLLFISKNHDISSALNLKMSSYLKKYYELDKKKFSEQMINESTYFVQLSNFEDWKKIEPFLSTIKQRWDTDFKGLDLNEFTVLGINENQLNLLYDSKRFSEYLIYFKDLKLY